MIRTFAGLVVVLSFSLLSIGSPGPFPPSPEVVEPPAWEESSDVALRLGRGWEDFREYIDGDPLPLTSGFQGGRHVHSTFLSDELTEDDEVTRILTWYVDPDDESLLDGAYETERTVEMLEGGTVGAPFAVAFLGNTNLIGERVQLRVHVELADGRIARAWKTGELRWEDELSEWSDWLCAHQGGPECGLDAGPAPDAGEVDAGDVDGGNSDAGNVDAGDDDAGDGDAGNSDAGNSDAGNSDAGNSDAGNSDAGNSDAGSVDAG